jgi:hypothetical protein
VIVGADIKLVKQTDVGIHQYNIAFTRLEETIEAYLEDFFYFSTG